MSSVHTFLEVLHNDFWTDKTMEAASHCRLAKQRAATAGAAFSTNASTLGTSQNEC